MMKNIMVVDNEPETVALVKTILENKGYMVSTAYSGKECLSSMKKSKPDLILLDIMMPDMSGWDVYQRIRKTDNKTKISFLSAIEVSPERKKTLLKSGVSDYITKPFMPMDLLKRVAAIVK
jgi:two-component system, OmpR family, response regulator VicR